jgi:hypothetical protein
MMAYGIIESVIWAVMTIVNILKHHIVLMEINALPQAVEIEKPTFNYLHMFDTNKLNEIMEKLPAISINNDVLTNELIREARCKYLEIYKYNQYRKKNNTDLTIRHRREAIQLNRLLQHIFERCNTN